jgi:dTDP-4-dehydrorhamnose 3,5-epimerase-like enzyme
LIKVADLDHCYLIDIPRLDDERGSLSFIEGSAHIPFDIARIYYLYDVPGFSKRGGHAHKQLSQLIFAVSGSFDIVLDDGQNTKRITLTTPDRGLYVCPMIWRDLENFSKGAVCMVLASNVYDAEDYISDYRSYLAERIKQDQSGFL